MLAFARYLAFAAALILPTLSAAQTQPIVVELFTSQGCSSCPPADAHLAELVERGDVLPLALHVTYWDRLGWRDTFGSEANTRRQYDYARTFSNRSVWTPQFVVHGTTYSRGEYRSMIAEAVDRHRRQGPSVEIAVAEDGGMLDILARPVNDNVPEAAVIVAHFQPEQSVAIKRGENAGRNISYHNVVTSWRVVGRLRKGKSGRFDVPMDMGRPVAVLIQEIGNGPMLGAQVLR